MVDAAAPCGSGRTGAREAQSWHKAFSPLPPPPGRSGTGFIPPLSLPPPSIQEGGSAGGAAALSLGVERRSGASCAGVSRTLLISQAALGWCFLGQLELQVREAAAAAHADATVGGVWRRRRSCCCWWWLRRVALPLGQPS